MSQVADPWERQPYPMETDEAWSVFVIYRDSHPRRVPVTLKGRPLNPVHVSRWMVANHWRARCEAYDAYVDSMRRHVRESHIRQETEDITAHHSRLNAMRRELAEREMEKLLAQSTEHATPILKPRDAFRMISETIRDDRLIRGEATDRVEVETDLSGVSDEQLAAALAALEPQE